MDKSTIKAMIKEALRELQEEEREAKRVIKALKQRPTKEHPPKRLRQALAILAHHGAIDEPQWRKLIGEEMSFSPAQIRCLLHRYRQRMIEKEWLIKLPDGRLQAGWKEE